MSAISGGKAAPSAYSMALRGFQGSRPCPGGPFGRFFSERHVVEASWARSPPEAKMSGGADGPVSCFALGGKNGRNPAAPGVPSS